MVSSASATLKFGIGRTRIQSRTCPRSRRSQPLPIVPARIKEPQSVSPRPAGRRRKKNAIAGAAASETAIQTAEGNSPHAIPLFTVNWIESTPGINRRVSPSS